MTNIGLSQRFFVRTPKASLDEIVVDRLSIFLHNRIYRLFKGSTKSSNVINSHRGKNVLLSENLKKYISSNSSEK